MDFLNAETAPLLHVALGSLLGHGERKCSLQILAGEGKTVTI